MKVFSTEEIERRFPDGTIWRDRQGRISVMLPDGALLAGEVLEREMQVEPPPAAACARCAGFEQAIAEQREQIARLAEDVRRLEAMLQQLLAR